MKKSKQEKTGRSWAVLIGIDSYHESFGDVEFAGEDCRRLNAVLQQPEYGFAPENILLLTDNSPADRRPTFGNIHSWLDTWLERPAEDDMILIYFAGHGREMDGQCYLAPGDATLHSLKKVGIPLTEVQKSLHKCRARKKLLIVDACHSGAGRDVLAMSPTMESALSGFSDTGLYTVTSCGTDEISHTMKDHRQGVFSHFLVQALSGHCPADSEGRLTLGGVFNWVRERVERWASEKRCRQTPRCFGEEPDTFVLGVPGNRPAPVVAEVVDVPLARPAAPVPPPLLRQPVVQAAQPAVAASGEQSRSAFGKFIVFLLVLVGTLFVLAALAAFVWTSSDSMETEPAWHDDGLHPTQDWDAPTPIGRFDGSQYDIAGGTSEFEESKEYLQLIIHKCDITHIMILPLEVDTEDLYIEQQVTETLSRIMEEVDPKIHITTPATQNDIAKSDSQTALLQCEVWTEERPDQWGKETECVPTTLSLKLKQGDGTIWEEEWDWSVISNSR